MLEHCPRHFISVDPAPVLRLRPRVYDATGSTARNPPSAMDVTAGTSANPSRIEIDSCGRSINYVARQQLELHGARQSMSGVGNCFDNAVAESFFATLKKELVYRVVFATRTEAYDAIAAYIEGFYNSQRRHSAIGFNTPIEHERLDNTTIAA